MKTTKLFMLMIAFMLLTQTGKPQNTTNDFYDDAETIDLIGSTRIMVDGEIENPGEMDITKFQVRSLVIKEAVASADSNKFIGAYRYDGYSLYDILNNVVLKKKNAEEFSPIIDLYVKIENAAGESVVFSWGEIYYPVHRHEIIIANKVARIVPSKTEDLWPLPKDVKLIAGHDLLTERNISNPVKITVLSASVPYRILKDLKPLFSSAIQINQGDQAVSKIVPKPGQKKIKYETIFYGRGRGIHSTTPFYGVPLKEKLLQYFKVTPENLRDGYLIVAAADGYRAVYSFSEIFNRNDQAEVLLIEDPQNIDGGAFRLLPAADFFSDRAVKAVSEIRLMKE
jgi:hypothetical protein